MKVNHPRIPGLSHDVAEQDVPAWVESGWVAADSPDAEAGVNPAVDPNASGDATGQADPNEDTTKKSQARATNPKE